ncbi:MAG: hypothetical protein QOJ64_3980 [Acidobacteriota bacterium]|nr:hypothetical protein [Acidobacteriota bacterium]
MPNFKLSLSIDFTPVSNAIDANFARDIINLVNYSVIANTDSPVALRAGQFPTTSRTRVLCQRLNRFNDAVVRARR